MKLLPAVTLIIIAFVVQSDKPTQTATTEDGRGVILKSDGTWKYVPQTEKAGLTVDGFSEKQLAAFIAATLELRKVSDALTFDLPKDKYKEKMGKAKTVMDDAAMVLPKGAVMDALNATWELHVEAVRWWDLNPNAYGQQFNAADLESLKKKHPRLKIEEPPRISRAEMLSACWLEAKEKIEPLVKLAAGR